MSDDKRFVCEYCDTPCYLIMEGMGWDDLIDTPAYCPYDGSKSRGCYWKEVKE